MVYMHRSFLQAFVNGFSKKTRQKTDRVRLRFKKEGRGGGGGGGGGGKENKQITMNHNSNLLLVFTKP